MVPKSVLARAQLLAFFPGSDPHLLAYTAGDFLVNDITLSWDGGMLVRHVRHDHLMTAVEVPEEVIDPSSSISRLAKSKSDSRY
jgi:hypothetical protein